MNYMNGSKKSIIKDTKNILLMWQRDYGGIRRIVKKQCYFKKIIKLNRTCGDRYAIPKTDVLLLCLTELW